VIVARDLHVPGATQRIDPEFSGKITVFYFWHGGCIACGNGKWIES
jgi:hypothetical protein